MIINCSYDTPLNASGLPPTGNQPFQFSNSVCIMPDNASTTAGFTYGEIVSTTLLFLIFMVLCFDLFLKMLYPKK